MIDGQKLLIDLCEEEGVRRYIASDFTLDFRGLRMGELPTKDPIKIMYEYLQTKKTVRGVHIVNGLFMNTFWTAFGILDGENKVLRYWGSGEEKFDLMSMKTVAEFAAAVAVDEGAV